MPTSRAAFRRKCNGGYGKIGYIDRTGAVVIKPQFDRAHKFTKGIARVEIGRYVSPKPCPDPKMICTVHFVWEPR